MKSSEKRIKNLPLLIVSLSVIAVAAVAIILLLFTNDNNTAGSSGYIMPAKPRFIYSKNKVLYMYDDGTAKCISELPAEDYTLTNDGNKLFFLSDNSLWCGNIENEEIKTEKIADEVAFYTVNSDGSKAMYSAKNGDVFVYSKGSEAKKIGTNCTTEYMPLYMSDNADKVMYITKNEQLKYCDGTNGKVIFVDYVNSYTIRCSENLSTVMYGKTDYTTDYPGQKVIVYSNFGENKEVFGECRIFRAYPEKNIMYYTDFRNDLYYYENGKSVKIRGNDNSGISASDEPVLVTSGGKGFLVTKKDKTEEIAKKNGAIVVNEYRQGKGNVVRSMFRDIEADIYIMVDGDDTYPAEFVHKLIEPIIEGKADMAIGDRLSNGTYQKENKRHFHEFGNNLVKKAINVLFKTDLKDIMTGYRAFNKMFVKNMPVLSPNFEIETEMSLYALDKKYIIKEIPIDYRDRPEGSNSKLNTVGDGIKVVKTIVRMFKDYRPFAFFTILALIFLICGLAVGIPVLVL